MAGSGVVADLVVHVGADIADAESGLDSLNSKVEGSGANFGKASGVMAAGATAIGAGLVGSIMAAGDFEQVMNEVGVTSGATGEQFSLLSDLAMDIGKNTVFSATEGAQAISELSKAGISTTDILNGAAVGAANLAAAGGVDMPRAAEVMSNAMNAFSIDGTRAADVADIFAGAANASAADVNSLAMGLSQVAPSAAGLGISLEDTVAQLALFSDYGMQGSDAGTSMKTMLSSLTPSTKAAREAFVKLGLSTDGVNNAFFDANGQFVGMEAASGLLYDSLKGLTDEQRAMALETIFGSDASRAAEITFQAQKAAVEGTGQGYAGYRAAVEASGQATDVANAKMAGMNGAIESLKGSLETAGIVIGSAFTPAIEAGADAVNNAISFFLNLPGPIQTLISVVIAATGGILALGAGIGLIMGPLGAMLSGVTALGGGIAAVVGPAAAAEGGTLSLSAAFGAILGPLALVVAAIAGLYVAYQTNFLGFADGVNFAVEGIKGALSALGPLFTTVGDAINTFATAFTSGGLQAALDTLPASLSAVGEAFGNLGTQITDHLNNIDWANVAANFGTKAQEMLTALSNGFVTYMPTVVSGLITLATAIPNALISVAPLFLTKGGEIMGQLLQGITDKSPDIMAGLQTLSDGMAAAFNTAGEALLTKGTELIGSLKTGIDQKWPEVTAWLGSVAGLATTALGTLASTFLAQGIELLQGLKDGVDQKWPEVPGFLATVAGLVVAALGTLAETLKPAGTALITGLKSAIDAAWPQIPGWLATVAGLAITAIGDLTTTLGAAGTALITGLYTAATTYWPTVSAWIGTIASLAVTAIGDLIATFTPAGEALLTGLKTGIDTGWATVQTWLAGLGDLALSAVGDLSGALVSAGASLISGLMSGITSMIPDLIGQLGGITASLPDWKGPESTDKKILFQSGVWIMEGLIDGVQSQETDLRNCFGDITSTIHSDVSSTWNDKTFYNDGQEAGLSLLQGAQSMGDEIRDGIQQMVSTIWGDIEAGIDSLKSDTEAAINDAATGLEDDYSDTKEKTKENDKAKSKADRRAGRTPATSTMAAADDGLSKQEQRQQDREDKRAARADKRDSKDTPSSTSSRLSSVASKVTPTGPITIYQSNMFTIDIKKLEDMIEAGKFIRDLEPTRTIYLEVSE